MSLVVRLAQPPYTGGRPGKQQPAVRGAAAAFARRSRGLSSQRKSLMCSRCVCVSKCSRLPPTLALRLDFISSLWSEGGCSVVRS